MQPPPNQRQHLQHAEGYHWILVNGMITFEDRCCAGATPSKLLRRGRAASMRRSRSQQGPAETPGPFAALPVPPGEGPTGQGFSS